MDSRKTVHKASSEKFLHISKHTGQNARCGRNLKNGVLQGLYVSPPLDRRTLRDAGPRSRADAAVATLNEELAERGVEHRFSLKLSARAQ